MVPLRSLRPTHHPLPMVFPSVLVAGDIEEVTHGDSGNIPVYGL